MKRLITFAVIGALIGCLLLVIIDNPFVVLGYFGFYLIATITVFSIFFEKLKSGDLSHGRKITHDQEIIS